MRAMIGISSRLVLTVQHSSSLSPLCRKVSFHLQQQNTNNPPIIHSLTMVLPGAAAAAHAAGAGATALGLGMGKTDLDLTRELFQIQMQQAKRLWTADFATSSVRHAETCLQAARQHAQAQALGTATYWQAEKLALQSAQLARHQDARTYEMAWRAEVRESLRDELANQNNRFNIVMLCDTVCLSCVFSLIAEGSPPENTSPVMLNSYVFCLGLSTTLFTISMWCSVIVVRRLHEHTAATLEQKIFVQSVDLQEVWRHQVRQNIPTGADEMRLVNQAYEQWLDRHINRLGRHSIQLLSIGVVAMFVTAGILTHNRYQINFGATTAVYMFWGTVLVTSTAVLSMKYAEDKMEKRKQGVYDVSWQDTATLESGPFAKISQAAQQVFRTVSFLGDPQHMETLRAREEEQRQHVTSTAALHQQVARMRADATQRAQSRKEVLQLLTTAAEELDAIPEELLVKFNKILHDIDEADGKTANYLSERSAAKLRRRKSSQSSSSSSDEASITGRRQRRRSSLGMKSSEIPVPVDAQRIPVPLAALRKKLGEISLTTLLRIHNRSDEPLRLQSGVKLSEGRYIKSLALHPSNGGGSSGSHGKATTYHLYPVSEIAPHTEVVIVARSGGRWLPTSGIAGEIVYTNRSQSWMFRIRFTNELLRGTRWCHVQASPAGTGVGSTRGIPNHSAQNVDWATTGTIDDDKDVEYWQMTRDEIDRKANNEILVSLHVHRGEEAIAESYRDKRILKSGFLLKNKPVGLRLQWQQRWVVLTQNEIIYTRDMQGTKQNAIALDNILAVHPGAEDLIHKYVLEIHVEGREPYRLAATTSEDRNDWIRRISLAFGPDANLANNAISLRDVSTASTDTRGGAEQGSIECVQSERGTEVLPV